LQLAVDILIRDLDVFRIRNLIQQNRALYLGSSGIALCLAQPLASFAATTDTRTFASSLSALTVDGVSCGEVVQWQGGEIFGDVVVESPKAGSSIKKHLAGTHYAPIKVELNLPPAAPLIDCSDDLVLNAAGSWRGLTDHFLGHQRAPGFW